MGFGKLLKTVVKVGQKSLPIAAAFGVPFASTALVAVDAIHQNKGQDDKEAVRLVAASADALDDRLDKVEAFIEGLKAGGNQK